MEIHFNGPVQNVYTGNTEVYNDNAKKVVINTSTSSPNPATQHAQQAQVVEDVVPVTTSQPTEEQPQTQATTIDPSSLIFKTNEVNRAEVEALLKETLSVSKKKSVVCRKLCLLRDKFNLTAQDDTTKANIINAWLEKFGISANFKGSFNRKDFGSYYNKE